MTPDRYYRKLISAIMILSGGFLMLEHLMAWGGFDAWDLGIGHEWYGLALIILGFILSLRDKGKFKRIINRRRDI